MELGALVCKPKNPDCDNCPLKDSCFSFDKGNPLDYPVKEKKVKVHKRNFNYLVLTNGKELLLKKRNKKDIWQGLYDFPSLKEENIERIEDAASLYESEDYSLDGEFKHILSHQNINAKFWLMRVNDLSIEGYKRINIENLEDYPLPQLLIRYIKASSFFDGD